MTRADSVHSTPPTNTPIDPIYGAIAVHQKAYADYDKTVTDSAPDDENRAAFGALDKACRRLVLAETSTMAGLIALLRYMAPLLQEEDAPALPLEIQFWLLSSRIAGFRAILKVLLVIRLSLLSLI
jgi:hypothetical protein